MSLGHKGYLLAVEVNHSVYLPSVMKAIQEKLGSWERPVVTDYELAVLMTSQMAHLEEQPTLRFYEKVVESLGSFGLISPSKDFKPGTVYHLFGRAKPKAKEVACAADPFAYISHLSAMEFHGLTDRFSKILYLTTPPDTEWKELAKDRMLKDLSEHLEPFQRARLPQLRRPVFDRVEGVRVELMRRSSRGAFKTIKSPTIRVAMVGRAFLDMVREPGTCGGMQHVVDTYREHGARYLALIADEVEQHGNAVEKVRAGYLLDEVCRLSHPLVDGWTQKAQRGGSRLLDPLGEYVPHYSEKWRLSINVASLMPGGTEDAL